MPNPILPFFSSDMTVISDTIAVQQIGDTVFWYQGIIPVFRHHVRDERLFQAFCCQLINLGNATSAELAKALNINHEKLSRWARLERADYDYDLDIVSNFTESDKKKTKKAMS